TVSVTDKDGGAGTSAAVAVTVNPPVSITTTTLPNSIANKPNYSQTISASGGTGAKTFSVTSGSLPDGLNLNGSTGLISGTPTVANTFNFTITATDTVGARANQGYSVTIAAHDVATKLVFESIPNNPIAGQRLPAVKVDIEDQFGNIVDNA